MATQKNNETFFNLLFDINNKKKEMKDFCYNHIDGTFNIGLDELNEQKTSVRNKKILFDNFKVLQGIINERYCTPEKNEHKDGVLIYLRENATSINN